MDSNILILLVALYIYIMSLYLSTQCVYIYRDVDIMISWKIYFNKKHSFNKYSSQPIFRCAGGVQVHTSVTWILNDFAFLIAYILCDCMCLSYQTKSN
jgi:hypothetical protein